MPIQISGTAKRELIHLPYFSLHFLSKQISNFLSTKISIIRCTKIPIPAVVRDPKHKIFWDYKQPQHGQTTKEYYSHSAVQLVFWLNAIQLCTAQIYFSHQLVAHEKHKTISFFQGGVIELSKTSNNELQRRALMADLGQVAKLVVCERYKTAKHVHEK